MFAAFHNQSPLITMVCFSTVFISLEIAYFADLFCFSAKKKKKAKYRPVGRGVRWVRSLPSQAPEVHLFVDQLIKLLILFLFLFAECAVKLKIL